MVENHFTITPQYIAEKFPTKKDFIDFVNQESNFIRNEVYFP